jgi:hypothetical protein
MPKWEYNFVNDPSNDYELVVEIFYDEEEVAVIKQEKHGLYYKWYANDRDIIIPFDWLLKVMNKANIGLRTGKEL